MVANKVPSLEVDIERTSEASSVQPLDPYQLRDGLLTPEQIACLRQRANKGKRIARYHQKQNDVCSLGY